MAATISSTGLRRLADALDAMAEMSVQTGVTITAYSDTQITIDNHIVRIQWIEPDGDDPGHYTAEWPDGI
ncbi:hypothetical protein AB0M23_28455 [Streptomyces sp. NPDC052077]|uniref:hypothetical protein n=1 Tax=Streptomyces sp. NPDC052077 TaxID=3154757 RepID=UPI003436CE08